MIFASNLFLLYFLPVFLILYWFVPSKFKNYIALLGSLLFYAWGAPVFVFVLLVSSFADYLLSTRLARAKGGGRKTLLFIGIAYNLGLLLYFKYANFFVDNWNAALEALGFEAVQWTEVLIPLGISFFAFQKISFLVDISRRTKVPPANVFNYLLYVSFFPQLIAGPIVRYHEIADQIQDRRGQDNVQLRWSGMLRFCIGLARKVLIANPLSVYVQEIIALPEEQLSMQLAWFAPLIFAFVIYHDFGAYSDMAIGLERMMGFRIPENFDNPYTAGSISEFWRRWHISLTGWFRTYLFWPMRKYAKGKWGLHLNLWLVFVLVGFWHGAAWTFVLFGVWHGTWILVERLFLRRMLEQIPKPLSVLWTFLVVVAGIVPFVSPDLAKVEAFYRAMIGITTDTTSQIPPPELAFDLKFWFLFVVAATFSFLGLFSPFLSFQKRLDRAAFRKAGIWIWTMVALLLLVLSIGEIARMGFQPFIYFMF